MLASFEQRLIQLQKDKQVGHTILQSAPRDFIFLHNPIETEMKHQIEELGGKGVFFFFSIEYCVVFFVGQIFIRIH